MSVIASSSAASAPKMSAQRKLSKDSYYGQRDHRKLSHGVGVRLASDGSVLDQQCGLWEHGKFQEQIWVWRGFLPTTAPLNPQASMADALSSHGNTYVGSTSGLQRTPHGAGETFWSDGMMQSEGNFVNGKLEGFATFFSVMGIVYKGNFVNDAPQGTGCKAFPDGSHYEGEWADGQQQGIGRSIWPDASMIYEGQWEKNMRHGLGWLKHDSPLLPMQHGVWRNDQFVEVCSIPRILLPADSILLSAPASAATGIYTLLLAEGGYYVGKFNAAHQRHGKGTTFAEDGTLLQRGIWAKDVLVRSRDVKAVIVASEKPILPINKENVSAAAAAAVPPASNSSLECVICMDRPRDCIVDCVHFCLCYECAQSQKQCPICRVAITQRMQKRLVLS
jgi:hypothetical protein